VLRRSPILLLLCLLANAPAVPQSPSEGAAPKAPLTFDDAVKAGTGLPRLHSLLVSHHGELILERYFHGTRAASMENVKSASKSIISALVGIALERHLISGVTAPIAPYFSELAQPKTDPMKRKITVADLLTMRSGLRTTSNRYYGAWVASPNWVQHILTRPMELEPGEDMIYSTGNTHLLSAILTKVSGKDTWQFAQEAFAKPLGIAIPQWPRDPQGVYFGGNDMLLTPRDMVKIGELYLHGGKFKDRQIVPAAWVQETCIPRTQSPFSGQLYGYGWWIGQVHGFETCFAWGFGGQYIFVVPALDTVIISTSSPNVGEDRRGQHTVVHDLIQTLIIPKIAGEN
jgi:CubicO group peptidase (beta-lactamase class C family)